MAKCEYCGGNPADVKVKDESGVVITVCEECFESCCEGCERV